ncbi:hypothetical protein ACFRAO_34695 [Streptomyces sp. NPDC056656]|uniref:hypothetical protein n=1 Tax=Streptomyces sp. NPDC056656 TaxID=3345895 RepID=UPI0036840DB0
MRRRVDLARAADETMAAMPDDVQEDALALIDEIADVRELGAGSMTVVDAVLRERVWVVYVALGGVLVVLNAGSVS